MSQVQVNNFESPKAPFFYPKVKTMFKLQYRFHFANIS